MKSEMMRNVAVCLALLSCVGFGLTEAQANNCCQVAAGQCASGQGDASAACEAIGGAVYRPDHWCQTSSGTCVAKTGDPGEPELPVCEAIDADTCVALTLDINEVRIDQPSSDNDEYFELVGASGTLLAGLSYVVIISDCKIKR